MRFAGKAGKTIAAIAIVATVSAHGTSFFRVQKDALALPVDAHAVVSQTTDRNNEREKRIKEIGILLENLPDTRWRVEEFMERQPVLLAIYRLLGGTNPYSEMIAERAKLERERAVK